MSAHGAFERLAAVPSEPEGSPVRAAGEWGEPRDILVFRPDALGDVIMTSPAIRALAQHPSRPRITLLTSSAGSRAARLVPEIDAVIVHRVPWVKEGAEPEDASADRALLSRLRQCAFDAAVTFTVYSQSALPSALLAWLADIPRRLGHCRENPYRLLTHWVPDLEPVIVRHEVQRQLDLVASVGYRVADDRIRLRVRPAALEQATALLRAHGVTADQGWVLLHPGASAPSRRYPPEQFAAAGRVLAADGLRIVVTGSAAERPLARAVVRAIGSAAVDLAGAFDVEGFAALIATAPVVVSNNTSAVHLAAGFDTPVVDLYALTNPQHTPWRVAHRVLSHDVPCRNCYRSVCPEGHHACLRGVPPDAVAAATRALLARTAGAHPTAAAPPRGSDRPTTIESS